MNQLNEQKGKEMTKAENDMHIIRRRSRPIHVGSLGIGGDYPISVQSMTNTPTADAIATLNQIQQLADAGCDLARIAVPDSTASASIPEIVKNSPIPVVADIHFDYKLALAAIQGGIHGLRLNPGNIGAVWKVAEIVKAASERRVPIRIGVNGGSLEKRLLEKYGGPVAEALVESAMDHIHILEDLNYQEIKISLKASRVPVMLAAYEQISTLVDYPLHLGVTEAGLPEYGIIKSAVGIGSLLAQGIGDTIRVSLTGDPVAEVPAGRQILQCLELLPGGIQVISCPTCGRTQVDLAGLARQVSHQLASRPELKGKSLTIAVMGCVVNGPGEAREADWGVACGKGCGVLFRKGQRQDTVPESEIVEALVAEILKYEGAIQDAL